MQISKIFDFTYFFSGVIQMKVMYTKVEPERVKENRSFYKTHVRTAFITWCAYKGYFDGVLSKIEIERAKKGHLHKDLNIHHKMPLSGRDEGVNEFSNLTVIHKNTHEYINRYVFSPQLKPHIDDPYGTTFEINVPEYDFVDVKGIKYERAKQTMEFNKYKCR
jgi:hypothetical protein